MKNIINGDVRPRTNSSMLREPDVRSSQCSKTRTARNNIYLLHWISEKKGGRLCNKTILSLSDWRPKYGSLN